MARPCSHEDIFSPRRVPWTTRWSPCRKRNQGLGHQCSPNSPHATLTPKLQDSPSCGWGCPCRAAWLEPCLWAKFHLSWAAIQKWHVCQEAGMVCALSSCNWTSLFHGSERCLTAERQSSPCPSSPCASHPPRRRAQSWGSQAERG